MKTEYVPHDPTAGHHDGVVMHGDTLRICQCHVDSFIDDVRWFLVACPPADDQHIVRDDRTIDAWRLELLDRANGLAPRDETPPVPSGAGGEGGGG